MIHHVLSLSYGSIQRFYSLMSELNRHRFFHWGLIRLFFGTIIFSPSFWVNFTLVHAQDRPLDPSPTSSIQVSLPMRALQGNSPSQTPTGLSRIQLPPLSNAFNDSSCLEPTAQCALPEVFPFKESYQQTHHLIFRDDTTHSLEKDTLLQPIWSSQSETLRRKLMEMGVTPDQIFILPVREASDFISTIGDLEGPKRIYVFGHAGPFQILFGESTIDLNSIFNVLLASDVVALTHYGCEFVNIGALKGSQRTRFLVTPPLNQSHPFRRTESAETAPLLPKTIALFGHSKVSHGDQDDSPLDLENPIIGIRVGCTATRQGEVTYVGSLEFSHQKSLDFYELFQAPKSLRTRALLLLKSHQMNLKSVIHAPKNLMNPSPRIVDYRDF